MKHTILLVEDDAFLASIYAQKFERAGFDVSFATNGDDGLKLAQKDLPHLILLDLRLQPGKMDGFQLLKTLKANAALAHIPVLVLTNLGQTDDVKKCLALGAAGYLIKAHTLPQEAVKKITEILHANV